MDKLYYGVAYYDEYMPYDRLEKDIEMMKDAGINVVRIAEFTWSTHEPQNGVFDFKHVDRVLDAMYKAGIDVIIGTPTAAIPTWMVKEHPEVLATTPSGQYKYGTRQNMDITSPVYLYYAERIIRKLITHVKSHPAVIGYQADNETKHYNTCGPNIQQKFIKYIREKFDNDIDAMNKCFGLDYWSNRINAWEDFPSMDATINASLSSEFSQFQRKLATEYLAWQVSIINEYKREGQFVTQNFDFEWRGYSYGIQPDVNHFEASKPFDVVGVDIYHPSQDNLTGCEVSFCGDVARSLKGKNYLVLETQAQGHPAWNPFEGQLRLLAFSHVASGAAMVAYWHWHSIHNSFETYWKGLLSHDMLPNPVYNEAKTVGRDFERLSGSLTGLKIENKTALLVDNHSLTSLNAFKSYTGGLDYNDVARCMYDSLYRLNIGCDIVDTTYENLEKYEVIVVPPLYSAADEVLLRLNRFVENGGYVVYAMRSGFCDENVKVRAVLQPGLINKACGISYDMFTMADGVKIDGKGLEGKNRGLKTWIELITPTTAETLAVYEHHEWKKYSAVTKNRYGKGTAMYIGCFPEQEVIQELLAVVLEESGVRNSKYEFPVIIKRGVNKHNKKITFVLNYSKDSRTVVNEENGRELLSGKDVWVNQELHLEPWGVAIIEGK